MVNIDKHFWDDLNWARAHHTELLGQYEDEWVAVYDHKVVAHGPSGESVRGQAKQELGDKKFPMYFVDSASNIYASQSLLY